MILIKDYINDIVAFEPENAQEILDKELLLNYIYDNNSDVLLRDNKIAHLTSSGFIMNRALTKVLLVHHNIRNRWGWTGGHCDGDPDLLKTAIREAKEETGLSNIEPLSKKIVSIDILTVPRHLKRGEYINSHLHLSVAYLLVADESEPLKIKWDENTGVAWFDIEKFTEENFSSDDVYLYGKLITRAESFKYSKCCS